MTHPKQLGLPEDLSNTFAQTKEVTYTAGFGICKHPGSMLFSLKKQTQENSTIAYTTFSKYFGTVVMTNIDYFGHFSVLGFSLFYSFGKFQLKAQS